MKGWENVKADIRPTDSITILIYRLKQKPEKASPRQFRYLDFISQFTTDFQYVSGTSNTPADALPRLHAVTSRSVQCIDEQLQAVQEQDEELTKVLQTHTGLELKKLFVSEQIQVMCDTSTGMIRPFLPAAFRKVVFDNLHNLSHHGHTPALKLLSSLSRNDLCGPA